MFLLKGIQGVASHLGSTYLGMAIGTSNQAVAISDNGCVTETQRVASTNTIVTTTNTNDTSKHIGTFAITSTVTLKEAAVMTTSTTGGDSSARQVYGDLTLGNGDNVVFEFDFVVS